MTLVWLMELLIGCSGSTNINDAAPPVPPLELRAGVNEMTLKQVIDGNTVERSYLIHTPETFDPKAKLPLLFAFHGYKGSGSGFVRQFRQPVELGKFIGVYPDGIDTGWDLQPDAMHDVEFVEAILRRLQTSAGIEASKPVAMGFSNGSGFVHKLAMESERFVAISPWASQLLVNNQPQPVDAKVSVLQLHGTDDKVIPYAGGISFKNYNFMAAEAGAAAWASHNGCDSTPSETDAGPHVRLEWENCDSGARVVHYRLNGTGHRLPPNVDGGTTRLVVEFLLDARQ